MPEEVWYKCPDCDGEGWALGDDPEDTSGAVTCGACDGLRVVEGDVQDMDLAKALGLERVEP